MERLVKAKAFILRRLPLALALCLLLAGCQPPAADGRYPLEAGGHTFE